MQRLVQALPYLKLKVHTLGDIFWAAETDDGDRELKDRLRRRLEKLSESLTKEQMMSVRAFVEDVLIVGAIEGLRFGHELRSRRDRQKDKDAMVEQLLKHRSIRALLEEPSRKTVGGQTNTERICRELDNLHLQSPPKVRGKTRFWADNTKHEAVISAISKARRKFRKDNSDIDFVTFLRSTARRDRDRDAKNKSRNLSQFSLFHS